MGVVSRRWMCVESMGCVASGCGCKEVYIYQRGSRHKKVGGQKIRYFHLSCKLKYAEALL